MNNLIFSLNATMPVFLVMVVGYFLYKFGFTNDEFLKTANRFVFKITLPCLLLMDMMQCDIKKIFDGKYVLYCALTTITCIMVIWGLSKLLFKDKSLVGEFVQCSYRGSAAILGIALLESISTNAKMAPLMMLGSVPIYNIFAVIVLTIESPENKGKNAKDNIKKSLKGICTNPIILSILGGMLLSVLDIHFLPIVENTITKIGSITTPLALIVIGGGFKGKKAIKAIKPTVIATCIKLIVQPMIFLPVAISFGFSGEKIVAALIMLGAPTTATSYVMAKSMGHEGVLSSSVIALTTLLSAFSITIWIFILKMHGII